MIARLRAKPGGSEIPVTIGDFATTRVDGVFGVVYLVFNTIMNLTTQEPRSPASRTQPRTFARRLLRRRGRAAAAATAPTRPDDPSLLLREPTRFGFDEYDVANQGLVSHHYDERDGTFAPWSIPFRYVWPSELDLMARIAGMRSRERWSGWRREPFTSESDALVGVWEKPA